MIKFIFLLFIFVSALFATVVKSPITSVNEDADEATLKIERVDVGMSGFIVHKLSKNHGSIIKEVVVTSYDKSSKVATLKMRDFTLLKQNALPRGEWHVEVGDLAVLAFGYSRAMLIAPNEDVYERVLKASQTIQWIHPDLFATILSQNGHPSPQKEDFDEMADSASVGVIFVYINQKLFTIDSKSFKILNISDAPLKQESKQLPFFTRVTEIHKAWWGAGSSEMDAYEPYYYELLLEYNEENQELQKLYNEFKTKK